jgi:hypothetical protein
MDDPNSAFDDTDQLSQMLQDTKASDTLTKSNVSDATALLQTFSQESVTSPWTSLDRATVTSDLQALIGNPRLTQQNPLELCGPAAFFSQWIQRDPVKFVNFVTALYDTGTGQIGSLTVTPNSTLAGNDYNQIVQQGVNAWPQQYQDAFQKTYPGTPLPSPIPPPPPFTPMGHWLILGSLRNSTNHAWQPSFSGDPNDSVSGLSLPADLTSWFTATGIYASVDNQTNLLTPAGIPHALGLNLVPGTDIALLVNANIFHLNLIEASKDGAVKGGFLSYFPNHWIVLLNQVTQDVMTQNAQGLAAARGAQNSNSTAPQAGDVLLTVWSWGQVWNLRVPAQVFIDNYYGAVIAKLA